MLVVDDDQPNRELLARRLDQRGYAVTQASSGPEALSLVGQHEFDVVLLDVEMPSMNGYEVLQRIRQDRSPGVLPVIMVTGRDGSADIAEALALGANDFIGKPIDFQVTLARMDTQVQRKRIESQVREREARYAAVVAGATDAIWDWTLVTNEFYASEGWSERFGWEPRDAASATAEMWLGQIHEDDRARVRREVDAHIAGMSRHLQVEYRLRDAARMYRWVLMRGLAVRDAQGRAIRLAGSLADITESKESDTLTSLSSRVHLMERMGQCIERLRRRNLPFAVILMEVHGLRAVNDARGRSAGDRLLVAIARRLENEVQMAGVGGHTGLKHTLARLDGDEFAMLLPDARDPRDVSHVAHEIRRVLAEAFRLDQADVYVSVSMGIVASATGYQTADDVMRDAGTALSKAKAQGKSHHEVFERDMRHRMLARQQVEVELRPALERGELRLHYQPILRLDREAVVGFEALLRWAHPERGLLQPDEFVSLAEEVGLIVPMGRWALREACRQLAAWRASGLHVDHLRVSVNLSAREFQQSDLVECVSDLLQEYGVHGRQLEVEITERAAMSDEAHSIKQVSQLRNAGVSVCLDDFGAGHSSLAYLHRFPVDRLKIDRSFVSRLFDAGESDSRPIVRAVLAMARDMGIDVVAEGVEGVEQFDLLCGLSCQMGQGFLFSKPVDAAAATEILCNGLQWASWQMGQRSLLLDGPTGSMN
ncbi:MAG: EAL domain-containing protein [Acidobacteria bacterium]|nr:EAL domain-containing protein [Acidobacteriota bacterium]